MDIKTLNDAIKAARKETTNPVAKSYAEAAMSIATEYGTKGLACQLVYLLNNLQGWRGDRARKAKVIMRAFVYKWKKKQGDEACQFRTTQPSSTGSRWT